MRNTYGDQGDHTDVVTGGSCGRASRTDELAHGYRYFRGSVIKNEYGTLLYSAMLMHKKTNVIVDGTKRAAERDVPQAGLKAGVVEGPVVQGNRR